MKTKIFLLIVSGICCYSSIIGQSLIKNLNKQVWKILGENAKESGAYNAFISYRDKKGITFLPYGDQSEWIKIYEHSDTLFMFQCYDNRNTPPMVIFSSTTGDNIKKCLMALIPVLTTEIESDSIIHLMEPFMDPESSKFYFTEIEKAERIMKDVLFSGRSSIQNHKLEGTSTWKQNYYCMFVGPGDWMLSKTDYPAQIIVEAPLRRTSNLRSAAEISCYQIDNKTTYRCTPFGCFILIGDKETKISLDEFKRNYTSVF